MESLNKENLDDVKKKLQYIKVASNGLLKVGGHIRKTITKRINDLDSDLIKYI